MDQEVSFRQRKKELLLALEGQVMSPSVRQVRLGLQRLCRLTDETLQQLWHSSGLSAPLALLAVGGYGRGELFPYSDVDVLVLLPNDCQLEHDEALRHKVETFIGRCWDSGLEIGSSVRTLEECLLESTQDITIQTSLLESRLLAGCQVLAQTFQRRYRQAMDPMAFFVAKTLEMNQRHTKFENTPYALEPNCKESPGGLRDLQILLWVAKAAQLGNTWDDLAQQGLITALEARQLKRNEAQLSLIRVRLHLAAGRREDRLVFDLQAQVAKMLGMGVAANGDFNARLETKLDKTALAHVLSQRPTRQEIEPVLNSKAEIHEVQQMLQTLEQKFEDEFRAHVQQQGCPPKQRAAAAAS